MKTIIAGSRDFDNYELVKETLLEHNDITEIVCGCAHGADSLGEKFALEHGIPIKRFPADWNRYGRSAGYRRNEQMAAYAERLIAFWDGRSPGTKHMIDLAKKAGLKVSVIIYE